jgi:hypothetical protein
MTLVTGAAVIGSHFLKLLDRGECGGLDNLNDYYSVDSAAASDQLTALPNFTFHHVDLSIWRPERC